MLTVTARRMKNNTPATAHTLAYSHDHNSWKDWYTRKQIVENVRFHLLWEIKRIYPFMPSPKTPVQSPPERHAPAPQPPLSEKLYPAQ